MTASIVWRLMFRVSHKAAFDRRLALVLPLLGDGCEVGEGRPYWKMPEWWACYVHHPVTGSAAEQVFACLVIAQRVGRGWSVCGPSFEDRADGLGGVFAAGPGGSHSTVPGLVWASFTVVGAAG